MDPKSPTVPIRTYFDASLEASRPQNHQKQISFCMFSCGTQSASWDALGPSKASPVAPEATLRHPKWYHLDSNSTLELPQTTQNQAIRGTNAQNKSPHSSLGLQMSARSRILGAQWCKMPPSTNPSICKSSNFLCPIPQSSACRWGAGGRGRSPVDTPRQSLQDCR